MTWLVILIAFAAALAVFPFLRERQRIAMTPALRKKAEGQFAKLSDGLTHYSWSGGARGPVIVAVHGLTTPGIVWSAVTPILTGLGFRVLSYDLYGRGFSDAARGKQNLDFFVRQLDELLADQKVSDNITLMGYSMGGSILTAFAAAQTHRIARVLLIAPAWDRTERNAV
jgi:pimeloyl-ACP methyl ester carboxylesterase